MTVPWVPKECSPVGHIFGIRCEEREALEKYLNGRGIGTNKHYPIPIHMQDCYKDLGYSQGSYPVAETISRTELSLPMYYGMTDEEIEHVIETVNAF